jgi:hypothetical protein
MSEALAVPQERYGAHRLTGHIGPGSTDPAAAVDVYPGDLGKLHSELKQWFEDSEQASRHEREFAEQSRNYYDGYQWTTEEQKALRERGQPEITINKIHDKVAMLCGLERRARTDPKAFPRTPSEEDRADAATQALRYIADDNNYPLARSAVFEEMLVEGYGGVELTLEDDGQGGTSIVITHVPWDRLWYDPHSRRPDFSDARYLGAVVWMDRDAVEELYPGAADVIDASFQSGSGIDSYSDRPDNVVWSDNRRSRVRVVQCHWVRSGTWWQATYTKGGLLTDPVASPFKDRHGKSACGILLQSAYIDRENRRYGMVRNLISLQDEINKRRSKALHLLSVHQTIAEKGAVKDVDAARQELARPDGYVEVNAGMRFEVMPGGEMALGQFQLLQHATAEMQLSGPNAAMSGTESRELSGRAILAQQAGGATQNEPLADSLRWWSRRVYEMAWMAVREYWTGPKWLRVTDDLGELRWVGLNRPVTVGEQMAAQIAKLDPQQQQMAMQQLQQAAANPQTAMQLQQVVNIENDIAGLDVDITISEGVDVPAMAAENFQTLVQLAGMQPGLIPPEVLIAASSLRDKDQLLAMMKQHAEAKAAQQQKMAPLIERNAVAEVSQKEAKAQADFALAKERGINSVKNLHSMHSDFSAPPAGQPWVAPDAPSAPGTAGGVPPLTPMDLAHQMADLHTKRADLDAKQAKAASDRASVVQKLAQAQATLNPPQPRPTQQR